MDKSLNMEDDDYVLVSKEAVGEDDAVSVQSDRSSLCMVDDPSADPGLFEDTDEEGKGVEVARDPPKEIIESDASETAAMAKPEPVNPQKEPNEAIHSSQPKYVCYSCSKLCSSWLSHCSADVAATGDVVWEGYMGANVPAYLFKKVSNIEASAEPRQQQLSTGTFLVQDMKCKNCATQFGWRYLKAWTQLLLSEAFQGSDPDGIVDYFVPFLPGLEKRLISTQEQKYKEGTTIVQRALVHRVN